MKNNIYLSQKWIEHCQELPESGMGFQNVNLTLKDGTKRNCSIYNCSILNCATGEAFQESDIVKIEMA